MGRANVPGCRSGHWPGSRRSNAPAATDRLAPTRRATGLEARQHLLRDGENFGGEVSFEPPFTSFDHLVGDGKDVRRNGEAKRLCGLEVDHQIKLTLNRRRGFDPSSLCPLSSHTSLREAP